MKLQTKLAAIALAAALCLSVLPACGQAGSADPHSARQIIEYLTSSALLGRGVGTPGNAQAGDYIAQQFEAIGMEPLFDSFQSPYPQLVFDQSLGQPKLEITFKDGAIQILEFGADYSFNFAIGETDVAALLTSDMGVSAPKDYALLADDTSAEAFYQGFALTISQRNTQFITIHKSQAYLGGKTTEPEGKSILINPEIYQRLVSDGYSISFSCNESVQEITANNIIGRFKGQDSSKAFIVSAHFDGAGGEAERYSQGAVDNASGVAALLHCAAQISKMESLPYDIVFCAFNGEETALQGSAYIAPQIESEYTECININIDCVGNTAAIPYSLCDSWDEYYNSPIVAAFVQEMDKADLPHSSGEYASSDHRSFACPSIALGAIDSVFHTTEDTADKLDIDEIEAIGNVVQSFITGYSGVFSWKNITADDEEAPEYDTYLPRALAAIEEIKDIADSLAYDEAYTFALEDDVYVTISGKRLFESAEECAKYFPQISLPQQASDYSLHKILVLDRRKMTPENPEIAMREDNSPPLETIYKLELEATAVLAIYENAAGDKAELSISKFNENTDYSDPMYEKHKNAVLEGELYLLVWEGEALCAVYHKNGITYKISYVMEENPYEAYDDFFKTAYKGVSKEKILELFNNFDISELNANIDFEW